LHPGFIPGNGKRENYAQTKVCKTGTIFFFEAMEKKKVVPVSFEKKRIFQKTLYL
jgi:hypothetical protein